MDERAQEEDAREGRQGCLAGLALGAVLVVALVFTAARPTCGCTAPISSLVQPPSQSAEGNAQDSALPLIQPSDNTATPAGATPESPTPESPAPEGSTPSSSTPSSTPSSGETPVQSQTPTPTKAAAPPPPTTAPAPECEYPSEINITGGDTDALPGTGGSFTVDGSPVVISAQLHPCGEHYELVWTSDGGANGTDCEMAAFDDNITSDINQGDTISVEVHLPPNGC